MEKKRYYVSVQAKTIMERQGDAAYELDIEATPHEVHQLYELFESESDADLKNYIRVHNPQIVATELVSHEAFDAYLHEIYNLLYQLGTPETRAHIRSMNVLNGIDP